MHKKPGHMLDSGATKEKKKILKVTVTFAIVD